MSGAYVAKPEATPDPPDVPDGWNDDWEHPGPFPPGYIPDYSHVISGDSTITYDGTSNNTVTLYDHVSYRTTEPTGSQITWTATIGGTLVKLRLAGGGDYSASVVSSYSDLGSGFYGASVSFEFDIDADNVGDNIVLTSLSTVDGYSVTDSYIIAVVSGVTVSGIVTRGGSPVSGAGVQVSVVGLPIVPPENTSTNALGEFSVNFDFADVDGRTFTVQANDGSQYADPVTGLGPASEDGETIDAGTITIPQVASATITFHPEFDGDGDEFDYVRAYVTQDGWLYAEPTNEEDGDGTYSEIATGQAPLDQEYQGSGVGLITWDSSDCDTMSGDAVRLKVSAGVGSTWTGRCVATLDYKLDGETAFSDTKTVSVAAGSPSPNTNTEDWFTVSEDLQTVTFH